MSIVHPHLSSTNKSKLISTTILCPVNHNFSFQHNNSTYYTFKPIQNKCLKTGMFQYNKHQLIT